MFNPSSEICARTNNLKQLIAAIDSGEVDNEINELLLNVKPGLVAGKLTKVHLEASQPQLPKELFSPEANHVLLNPELAQTSMLLI